MPHLHAKAKQRVPFTVLRHEPVYTSEEAARVRGTPLASGAKALICKGEDAFIMFVVPAHRKLDSRAVRRAKGWRKLRFATKEEVLEMTGLAPGSIPPFGNLFGLPTLCDERLADNDVINFNFADWKEANRAPRRRLNLHDQYYCAPQVFYFRPQKLWYLLYQIFVPCRQRSRVPWQPLRQDSLAAGHSGNGQVTGQAPTARD
jgi:Ala-tRNA(Pro) deacylase